MSVANIDNVFCAFPVRRICTFLSVSFHSIRTLNNYSQLLANTSSLDDFQLWCGHAIGLKCSCIIWSCTTKSSIMNIDYYYLADAYGVSCDEIINNRNCAPRERYDFAYWRIRREVYCLLCSRVLLFLRTTWLWIYCICAVAHSCKALMLLE